MTSTILPVRNLPWLWVNLSKFLLVRGNDFAVLVEDQEPARGGTLVN